MSKFTIGGDPEVFLVQKGELVPAYEFITGTKKAPQVLPSGGAVQWDNVAMEFNIKPATTEDEWIKNIATVMMEAKELLPKDVDYLIEPAVDFPENLLNDKRAKEFGCSPDFNAWKQGAENECPKLIRPTLRSAGGHVTIGGDLEWLQDEGGKMVTICMCDYLLGVFSLSLDTGKAAQERRTLYGKAGCFRPTPFGVEYRTLSNFWLKSPTFARLIYRLTKDVMSIMEKERFNSLISQFPTYRIINGINAGKARFNAKHAQQRIVEYNFVSSSTNKCFQNALSDQSIHSTKVKAWRKAA